MYYNLTISYKDLKQLCDNIVKRKSEYEEIKCLSTKSVDGYEGYYLYFQIYGVSEEGFEFNLDHTNPEELLDIFTLIEQ